MIASGGAATPEHLKEAFDAGADAVLAASIFHDDEMTVGEVKRALAALGVPSAPPAHLRALSSPSRPPTPSPPPPSGPRAAMIVQSPRCSVILGPSRPDPRSAASWMPGSTTVRIRPFLPVSPTMSGVRWSMRSWGSFAPAGAAGRESHGRMDQPKKAFTGKKLTFSQWLDTTRPVRKARRCDHPIRAPGAQRPTPQLNPATGVRCLTTQFERRTRSAARSQLKPGNPGSMPDTQFEPRARSAATSQLKPGNLGSSTLSIRAGPQPRNRTAKPATGFDARPHSRPGAIRHVTAQPATWVPPASYGNQPRRWRMKPCTRTV